MEYRRNLRDIVLIVLLAALFGLGWPRGELSKARSVEEAPAGGGRLTIHTMSLYEKLETPAGDLDPRLAHLDRVGTTFGSTRLFTDSSRSTGLIVRDGGFGINYLEGNRLERDGELVAGQGISREMLMSRLGRPDRTRTHPDQGTLEDLYLEHQLVVRYRGYQMQRVWMVAGIEHWLKAGNWPEALGDYVGRLDAPRIGE